MFERKRPIFTKGRILKNEMLELIRDFPRNVTDIFLAHQTDGVISGLDLKVSKTDITINSGIVKYQGEVLILDEELKIPYVADDSVQILKLQFQDNYQTSDFEGLVANVILENGACDSENQMEIASFRLSQGAYLRSDYQDFEDFKTGHNTLNIVNQPYSSISGTTLSPVILKYFARELLKYGTENSHDLAIIYQVLNGQVSISKELLANYVRARLKDDRWKFENNEDLHKGLTNVLKKAKVEDRGSRRAISGNRRLIVD